MDLQADAAVKSISILLDGVEVAVVRAAPWHAMVDLGPELQPHDLTAVARDRGGNEIARVSQILNLPRPNAEIEIELQYDGKPAPHKAQLQWRHLMHERPVRGKMTVDGAAVRLDRDFHASLPALDWTRPHVIAAQLRFADGFVATQEVVVGGEVADYARSEMTSVLLTETAAPPASLDGCFSLAGTTLRSHTLEKPRALVTFVRDPNPGAALHAFGDLANSRMVRTFAQLDADTVERYLWPVSKNFEKTGEPTSVLFPPSNDMESVKGGLVWLLTRRAEHLDTGDEQLRVADAVAVAGLRAMKNAERRAVVLLVSDVADHSTYAPHVVRHYLATIGVPLFVWSFSGPRPDLAASWGEVDDISDLPKLKAAAGRLRSALAAQRIAWVSADPLSALHVDVDRRCGLVPVAVRQ